MARRDALIPAALAYAARGWHVFPLRPGDKRPAFPDHAADHCRGRDPRCRAARRHVTWEERATTDRSRIIRAWQAVTPAGPYGIGIACGPSGLLVIDLDTPKPDRHGVIPSPPEPWDLPGVVEGADVLAVLAEQAGQPFPIGSTWTAHTGSGGLHLYFRRPATPEGDSQGSADSPSSAGSVGPRWGNTAGELGWLIDTRGWGGYVVAPPSVVNGHPRPYTVEHDATPPAVLPAWLAERLAQGARPDRSAQPSTAALRPLVTRQDGGEGARRVAYLRSAVDRQVELVATAAEGGRNHALFTSATALGQLVAGGELDAEHVTDRLEQAARTAGLRPRETGRTIASGLRAGGARPRTLPSTSSPPPSPAPTPAPSAPSVASRPARFLTYTRGPRGGLRAVCGACGTTGPRRTDRDSWTCPGCRVSFHSGGTNSAPATSTPGAAA